MFNWWLAILLMIFINASYLFGEKYNAKSIAVVRSSFDKIEEVLEEYKIPYKMIFYADLEKKDTFKRYRALFLPCGMRKSLEENITVSSGRTGINSVSLNDKIMATVCMQKNKLDFDDAIAYQAMKVNNIETIISYDTDFDKVKGINRVTPKELFDNKG